MPNSLFTSESVSCGHPDKICDQISDAILDACLEVDPNSHVAVETLVTTGLVVLAGEITSKAHVDYQAVVRRVIQEIGYTDPEMGFDYRSCAVVTSIHKQSPDIAQGVDTGGAGDQGMMFGYACDETPELMPLPIMLAHALIKELNILCKTKRLPYLRPDAKTQVTVEYDENHKPIHIDTIVVSTQHTEDVVQERIVADMKEMVRRILPKNLVNERTLFYINPTGRFVIGGPAGDTGVTGRKIIVDSYGGMGRHGGGAFSGKDASKVDRSGAYAARYVAKNIVASGLAKKCEIQIAYAIGIDHPVSITVETFNTGIVDESIISHAIVKVFDLSPNGIIKMLDLKRPIYRKTACGGHFGRSDKDFMWEQVDRIDALLKTVEELKVSKEPHPFFSHQLDPKKSKNRLYSLNG